MSRPDRFITAPEVREIVSKGEMIEDYPEDPRGKSCLIMGVGNDSQPIHVVCAPKDEFLAIITAYFPDPREWVSDFRTRKQS